MSACTPRKKYIYFYSGSQRKRPTSPQKKRFNPITILVNLQSTRIQKQNTQSYKSNEQNKIFMSL